MDRTRSAHKLDVWQSRRFPVKAVDFGLQAPVQGVLQQQFFYTQCVLLFGGWDSCEFSPQFISFQENGNQTLTELAVSSTLCRN